MVIIVANTTEEIDQAFAWLSGNNFTFFTVKKDENDVKNDENKKQKKAEYDKKRYEEKKNSINSTMKKVESIEEKERDEKEEVLPLDSPSSLLSSPPHPPINYPITPFNPPLPEERGERERDDDSGAKPNLKPKPQKHQHGSAKNVLLTDEEYEKLKERFPDADDKIEAMSLYFESKGNAGKYKSHYATFLNWERMAREREQTTAASVPKAPKEKTFGDIRREMEQQKTDSFVDSFWRN